MQIPNRNDKFMQTKNGIVYLEYHSIKLLSLIRFDIFYARVPSLQNSFNKLTFFFANCQLN